MKLKDQKILDRQIAKKELEKAKAIQEYVGNLTLEKQTTLQNMIENVKIYCQQYDLVNSELLVATLEGLKLVDKMPNKE